MSYTQATSLSIYDVVDLNEISTRLGSLKIGDDREISLHKEGNIGHNDYQRQHHQQHQGQQEEQNLYQENSVLFPNGDIPHFEHLMMRGVWLEEKESETLLDILLKTRNDRNKVWKNIDIHHCGGSSYQVLTAAIAKDIVRHVRLINVDAGNDGFAMLGKALHVNTSLSYLRLTTSILEGSTVAPFADGLETNTSLTSIDFKYSVFGTSGCQELARGLRKNKYLRDINLSGCNLHDEHGEILIRAFQNDENGGISSSSSSLETIDLNGNFCGRRTSAALADILKSPGCKLRKLDLGCQRGDAAFDSRLLCAALAQNTSLEVLDLSNMSLGDQDAMYLARALAVNTTLKELYISRNKITIVGIQYFAEALSSMKGLKKLSLWGNMLSEEAADKLLEGLYDNHELEYLELFQEFNSSREIKQITLLNRGGRKIFQTHPNKIQQGLWPHLIERINKRRMAKRVRQSDEVDIAAKREAIFYFLQSPVLLNR